MKTLPQFDPYRRYLYAGYTITRAEIELIFQQNPTAEVIVMWDGMIIERPEDET